MQALQLSQVSDPNRCQLKNLIPARSGVTLERRSGPWPVVRGSLTVHITTDGIPELLQLPDLE